jgi:hypothetical protein
MKIAIQLIDCSVFHPLDSESPREMSRHLSNCIAEPSSCFAQLPWSFGGPSTSLEPRIYICVYCKFELVQSRSLVSDPIFKKSEYCPYYWEASFRHILRLSYTCAKTLAHILLSTPFCLDSRMCQVDIVRITILENRREAASHSDRDLFEAFNEPVCSASTRRPFFFPPLVYFF